MDRPTGRAFESPVALLSQYRLRKSPSLLQIIRQLLASSWLLACERAPFRLVRRRHAHLRRMPYAHATCVLGWGDIHTPVLSWHHASERPFRCARQEGDEASPAVPVVVLDHVHTIVSCGGRVTACDASAWHAARAGSSGRSGERGTTLVMVPLKSASQPPFLTNFLGVMRK